MVAALVQQLEDGAEFPVGPVARRLRRAADRLSEAVTTLHDAARAMSQVTATPGPAPLPDEDES